MEALLPLGSPLHAGDSCRRFTELGLGSNFRQGRKRFLGPRPQSRGSRPLRLGTAAGLRVLEEGLEDPVPAGGPAGRVARGDGRGAAAASMASASSMSVLAWSRCGRRAPAGRGRWRREGSRAAAFWQCEPQATSLESRREHPRRQQHKRITAPMTTRLCLKTCRLAKR